MQMTWPLTLPADLVPGSERARVDVVGDLLGPSMDVRGDLSGTAASVWSVALVVTWLK